MKMKTKESKSFCISCGKNIPNTVDFFCLECMKRINQGHDLW